MKTALRNLTLTIAGAALLSPFAYGAIDAGKEVEGLSKLENEVRHELVMLPWYGVFDNLQFRVDGDHVILSGQVNRPTLRSDAERVVRSMEGVTRVTNEIEVLPLSPNDDRIRRAAYHTIFGYSSLGRYTWGAVPPVRIIVKNGTITLEGVVANEMDKNMAGIRANGVSGAFEVRNNLRVENSRG
jgi:hyperosmotically inducible protein